MGLLVLLIGLRPGLSQDTSAGSKLYLAHCAGCHGQHGEGGRGVRLTTPGRATNDDVLFGIVRNGIPGTEMPPARLGDEEVRQVVLFVRTLRPAGSMAASEPVSRGERIYRTAGCAACHVVGSEGGFLGPDLSNIGARRSVEYLRRALLEPEADIPDNFGQYRWYIVIPDNFLQVRVTTADGRSFSGARANEDSFSIQLRDGSGRFYSFWKSDLKELQKNWGKSPMPSYRDKLSASEIDELVGYLSGLRGSRRRSAFSCWRPPRHTRR